LGLAQVYGIVEAHEGHIAVETEPDKGTTFAIYFPAVEKLPNGNDATATLPQGKVKSS
jgi:signal transduction histidine kinase